MLDCDWGLCFFLQKAEAVKSISRGRCFGNLIIKKITSLLVADGTTVVCVCAM